MYMTLDRPVNPKQVVTGVENIAQFREFYVTAAALEALRKGEPVPSGTVGRDPRTVRRPVPGRRLSRGRGDSLGAS